MIAVIVVALPLLLALGLAAGSRPARVATALAPAASALLLLPVFLDVHFEGPWLLEGILLKADAVARPLLLLTSLAWTAAAAMARRSLGVEARGFWVGWLLALAGMGLLLLAGDLVSFYVGYAVSSLSSFLLVIHHRTPAAWRAGRVYLVMAVAAETSVLAGLMLVAGPRGNVPLEFLAAGGFQGVHPAAGWLLFTGFAVKLGILPLHVWLPLAHPEAPVPASAILSGVIVKAGLLGWLRMLPPDALGGSGPSTILFALGIATAFGGVALGLVQHRPKTVLAYSTVSQMGLVLAGFSLVLRTPDAPGPLVGALGFFALHHGLNKAALFLACGNLPGASRWRLALTTLPALGLAAAPLSSGWLAKKLLESGFEAAGLDGAASWLLSLTSTATALLMWRLWVLVSADRDVAEEAAPPPAHPSWVALTVLAVAVPWAWAGGWGLAPGLDSALDSAFDSALDPAKLWSGTWPLLLATGIAFLWWRRPARFVPPSLPEGDVVVVAEWLARRARRLPIPSLPSPSGRWTRVLVHRTTRLAHALEARLGLLPLTGALMIVVGGLFWWLLQSPR